MSLEQPSNLAASIRAKLKNLADAEGLAFQNVLTRYGIERFLYRLSQSRHAERFVLKGAALFVAWGGHAHRATRDLDLLGHGASDVDAVVATFQEILAEAVAPDGLVFDPSQTRGAPIKEGQKYRGVRLHLLAKLGQARVPVQVDVGFGDSVAPKEGDYPTLLDLPAPRLQLYPRESVVAEKVHAMVTLGLLNGRLKDFFDLWFLATTTEFEAKALRQAIAGTFKARSTPWPSALPEAWTEAFLQVPGKAQMWAGFVKKAALPPDTPPLQEILSTVRDFAWPILEAEARGVEMVATWRPGQGWT